MHWEVNDRVQAAFKRSYVKITVQHTHFMFLAYHFQWIIKSINKCAHMWVRWLINTPSYYGFPIKWKARWNFNNDSTKVLNYWLNFFNELNINWHIYWDSTSYFVFFSMGIHSIKMCSRIQTCDIIIKPCLKKSCN